MRVVSDAGMAQQVSQPGNILAGPVKGRGEQVAEVMGNTLDGSTPACLHSRFISAQTCRRERLFAASREKNLAGGGFLLLGVFQQLPAEFLGGGWCGFFLSGKSPAPLGGLHGDIADLAHPDARGADGLHQQSQPVTAQAPGCLQQTVILRAGQLPALLPEQAALDFRNFTRQSSQPRK